MDLGAPLVRSSKVLTVSYKVSDYKISQSEILMTTQTFGTVPKCGGGQRPPNHRSVNPRAPGRPWVLSGTIGAPRRPGGRGPQILLRSTLTKSRGRRMFLPRTAFLRYTKNQVALSREGRGPPRSSMIRLLTKELSDVGNAGRFRKVRRVLFSNSKILHLWIKAGL